MQVYFQNRECKLEYKDVPSICNLASYMYKAKRNKFTEFHSNIILTDEKDPDKSYSFRPTISYDNN